MKMYKYLYYLAYCHYKKIKWEKDPEDAAYVMTMMIQIYHVATLIFLFSTYTGIDLGEIPWDIGKGKYSWERLLLAVVFASPFYIVNHFLIYRKRKEIIRKYNELKRKKRLWGQKLFWPITIGSHILVSYAMYLYYNAFAPDHIF